MHRPWPPPKRCPKPISLLLPLLSLTLLLLYSATTSDTLRRPANPNDTRPRRRCDPASGEWVLDPRRAPPPYDAGCPFHRNAWNCIRNGRDGVPRISSWAWAPRGCPALPRVDPAAFLRSVRGMRIGFVGDSLNENFLASFLCILRSADGGARRWKRMKAWRGGYFPGYDVTVAYHRAVLLAKYTWQPVEQLTVLDKDGLEGFYKVDIDKPADDWANITKFYDVLVFNTGHWWGLDKFPKEKPLVFYKEGKPIVPPLGISEGLQVVLESMVSFIENEVPEKTLKFWRTQSPRHFHGGEWDHNGSCLFTEPLKQQELDSWFDPRNRGVNREAREVNLLIQKALQGSNIRLLNLTHLSEFRADAHPAVWLGKKDAVAVWGQDCMHWCLPGVPDTWVDILCAEIMHNLEAR